jgi:hypothetical protein
MGYSDTTHIEAYSVIEDSVLTADLSYAFVGYMNDPVFGTTSAEWYSQLRLSEEPTIFGVNPTCDSAFLYLPISGGYGDTLSNMTIKVYRVTESIYDTIHSYSNKSVSYDREFPLGEITFTPRPNDSTYYNGKMHAPVLRIPLNFRFGNQILLADNDDLESNDNFLKYFKGIALVAEPQDDQGKGAVMKLSVSALSSYIDLHYHNSQDTTTYTFEFTSDCQRFNRYDHNGYHDASPLLQQQIGGDTLLGNQFLFLQAMGGIKVKLKFPFLKKWQDKEKILVNDAQLIFSNAMPSDAFTAPRNLSLYAMKSDGTLNAFSLPDANEGSNYFDGNYNSSSGTYRFRLTHYVQQVLNGEQTDYGLFLLIPTASLVSSRMVLNGSGSVTSPVKLYIKYTIIK